MKQLHIISLTLLSFFLTIVTAHAFNPSAEDAPHGNKRIETMQQQLHLTAEQTVAVKKIFTASAEQRRTIMAKHQLQPADLEQLHQKRWALKKDGGTPLHMLLNGRQMLTLKQDILGEDPASFQHKPRKAKLAQLQKELHIDFKKAEQISTILKQKYEQRQQILKSCNLTMVQMQAFQKDMMSHQKKIKAQLSIILSPEQMAQFAKMQNQ